MAADRIAYDIAGKRWDDVGTSFTSTLRDDGYERGIVPQAENKNYTLNQDFQSTEETIDVVNSHADDIDERATPNQLSLTGYNIADSEFDGLNREDATNLMATRLEEEAGTDVVCYQTINTATFPLLNTALEIGAGHISMKLFELVSGTFGVTFNFSRGGGAVTLIAQTTDGLLLQDWHIGSGELVITGIGITAAGGSYQDNLLNFARQVQLITTGGLDDTRPSLILPQSGLTLASEVSGRTMVADWAGDTIDYKSASTETFDSIRLT